MVFYFNIEGQSRIWAHEKGLLDQVEQCLCFRHTTISQIPSHSSRHVQTLSLLFHTLLRSIENSRYYSNGGIIQCGVQKDLENPGHFTVFSVSQG